MIQWMWNHNLFKIQWRIINKSVKAKGFTRCFFEVNVKRIAHPCVAYPPVDSLFILLSSFSKLSVFLFLSRYKKLALSVSYSLVPRPLLTVYSPHLLLSAACLASPCLLCFFHPSLPFANRVTSCFLAPSSLCCFRQFLLFFSRCISINFLLPSQAVRGEGAGGVWRVAEEAFRVHQQLNEDRLHHHTVAQGNHVSSLCIHTSRPHLYSHPLLAPGVSGYRFYEASWDNLDRIWCYRNKIGLKLNPIFANYYFFSVLSVWLPPPLVMFPVI